jgi:hypothetical protein
MNITITKLRKTYGPWADDILTNDGTLKLVEKRKRGAVRHYTVLKMLPVPAEFERQLNLKFTQSIDSAVSDAFSEIESLNDECQQWYDNLPQSFQDGDKGGELQNAIDALSAVSMPDVPESLADLSVTHVPQRELNSRATRLGDAVDLLREVVEILNDSDNESLDGASDLAGELENAIGEVEGVDFPGMY